MQSRNAKKEILDLCSLETTLARVCTKIRHKSIQRKENIKRKFKEKKFVVYCRSGNRSSKGTKILNKYGFEAVNLSGGMLQWKGPVEKI